MSIVASNITGNSTVCLIAYSGQQEGKHQVLCERKPEGPIIRRTLACNGVFVGLGCRGRWNPGHVNPRIILGMGSANEKRCYSVTPSLIGYAHTQKDPCNPCSTNSRSMLSTQQSSFEAFAAMSWVYMASLKITSISIL